MEVLFIQILRLGDALQLTPVIRGLKQALPEARIHVLTSEMGSAVFSQLREVDGVFVFHKQEIGERVNGRRAGDILHALSILKADLEPVMRTRWDWVINLSYSLPSALLAFLADGLRSSGFHAARNRQYKADEKLFSYAISAFLNRKYSFLNWVDINKGILGLHGREVRPHFPLPIQELHSAREHLRTLGFSGERIIGLHPGASGDYKRWPAAKFMDLAQRLVNEHGYRILVFGDREEENLGRQISESLSPRAVNMAGRTSLQRLAALISQCSVLVCNDSGPMHLAAAVGTPVVSLFFSTHFRETGPYGAGNIVLHPDIPCFPCKGQAECSDKQCLQFIEPSTVEKVVMQRERLIGTGGRVSLTPEEGPVAVLVSRWDPWHNLEWTYSSRRPLTQEDLIRCVYKMSMMPHLAEPPVEMHFQAEYFQDFLQSFDPTLEDTEAVGRLLSFGHRVRRLHSLLLESRELSMGLFGLFQERPLNTKRISTLGQRLEEKEREIARNGNRSQAGLLTEFIDISRLNIFEKDYGRLALRTAGLYQDASEMAMDLLEWTRIALEAMGDDEVTRFPRNDYVGMRISAH